MTTAAAVESPYKGLRPFEDSDVDALLFFGRERETEVIAANLLAARLTVLYGPSGVGKSSVLRAGVMNRLRSDGDLVVRFESWSGDPVAGIAEAVRAAVSAEVDGEVDDPGGPLAERLRAWSEHLGAEIYLVLDQVEEYFLYHGRNGRPDALLAELPDVVNEPALRVHVLLGIREDALALLDAFKARIPQVLGNYLRLDRLDRAAGEAAILGPLAAWQELVGDEVAAEPELVDALLDEVAVDGDRIEAPYLQVVLERIWEAERASGSNLLRRSTLAGLGGAERIVDEHLERALTGLGGAERDTAAAMFAHLVTPSGTKIAHELNDLASYAGADVRDVASALVRERILRPVDGGSNGDRVEIYHDVLAAAVADWRRRHETERQLARERRRQRKLAAIVGVLVLGLALMTALAAYAFSQRSEARDQATTAQARELAARALVQLESDPELSVMLAIEAAEREPSRQVEDVLRTALVQSKLRRVVRGGGPIQAVAFATDGEVVVIDDRARRRLGATTRPVLSRDGSVTAFARGARIVVSSGGRERAVTVPRPPVLVAVSDDGRAIAAADALGTVTVHTADSLRVRRVLRGPPRPHSLALDRGGRGLAVTSGRRIWSWDLATGRRAPVIEDRKPVLAVAASPDGRLLATGSSDGAARIWEQATGRLVTALANHGHHVTGVAFSADGSRLVTTSRDGVVRTWRTEDGHLFAALRGHRASATAAAFDATAGRVVTASDDGTARVWESGAADELRPILAGSVPFLDAVATRRFGVVAADERGIWVGGRRRVTVATGLSVAAFASGGVTVIGARGRSATVWRTRDGREVARALVPSRILSASVSATHLALGAADGSARVRRLGGGPTVPLRGHAAGVTAVAFGPGPGGARVATGDGAGVVRVWSADGSLLYGLRGHRDLVAGLAFSPDGRTLASTSRDTDVRTWNVETGRSLRRLVGHFAIVSDAAFSADGRWIVSAGPGTAGLWGDGSGPGLLRGHSDRVMSASFAPDGITVVTASRDGTVRLYRCDVCRGVDDLVALARRRLERTARELTREERALYLGER